MSEYPQEQQVPDEVMHSALDAAKELLSQNPVHDFEAVSDRVLADLSSEPNTYEVENLLKYPWFRINIIEEYFESKAAASDAGGLQNPQEKAWLSKLLTYYGYSQGQADEMVWENIHNYTTVEDNGRKVSMEQKHQFINKMVVLDELVEIDPSAPRALTEKWGITAFERHQRSRRLYSQLETNHSWNALCITPRSDHNGAFLNLEYNLNMYATKPFYVEAGSATELARIAVRLKATGEKFDKVIVAAHSDGESLDLSHDDLWTRTETLGIKQLSQERVRNWISSLGILSQGTEVTFLSCSTGKDGGIQEEVHKIDEVVKSNAPTETAYGRYDFGGIQHKTKDGRKVGRVLDKTDTNSS
jgi:hypothetical protein